MANIKETVTNFCKTSAIRGLARAAREPLGVLRVLWCVAVFIGSTIAAWYITKLMIRYYNYPTITFLQKVSKYTDFPDITVCNLQAFHSRVPHNTLQHMEYEHVRLVERMTDEKSSHVPWGGAVFYGYFSTMRALLQSQPKTIYRRFLHQLDDIIVNCSWHGWIKSQALDHSFCDLSDFELVSHPDNGNCFTVRVNETKSFSPKDVQSLRIILFTDSFFDYSFTELAVANDVEPMEGIALHIHEHGSYFDVYNVLNFGPGISATVELDRQHIALLSSPYGECQKEPFVILSDGTNTTWKYTVDSCYGFCLQETLVKYCNCVIADLPVKGTFENIPFCPNISLYESKGYSKKGVIDLIVACLGHLGRADCSRCIEPCESIQYYKTIHQTSWPHFSYQLKFYEKLISKLKEPIKNHFSIYKNISLLMENESALATKLLKETDLIRKNFLEITIRLQSHLVNELVESEDLTSESILGSIGGLLNLWIGISFVTLFEILDLLYRIVKPFFVTQTRQTQVMDMSNDRKW